MQATDLPSHRPDPHSWRNEAACQGRTDEMYPEDGAGVLRAKEICAECPVVEPCLDYALTTNQKHGVWGGRSERERDRMRRRKKRPEVLTCPNCYTNFPPRMHNQRYCTQTCRNTHHARTNYDPEQ